MKKKLKILGIIFGITTIGAAIWLLILFNAFSKTNRFEGKNTLKETWCYLNDSIGGCTIGEHYNFSKNNKKSALSG